MPVARSRAWGEAETGGRGIAPAALEPRPLDPKRVEEEISGYFSCVPLQRVDIIWIETMLRIESAKDPFTTPTLAAKGARALIRANAMGLLAEGERALTLETSVFERLALRLSKVGIGTQVVAILRTPWALTRDPEELERCLDRLTDALEASPVPASEWKRIVRVLGVEMAARLLGISPASVRRYARAARSTPDDVAARLHWLALIVGDLAGAYNEIGIRQWFDRKRAQLGGRRPAQLLSGEWKPDDPGPQQVRALADALTGSPAT